MALLMKISLNMLVTNRIVLTYKPTVIAQNKGNFTRVSKTKIIVDFVICLQLFSLEWGRENQGYQY